MSQLPRGHQSGCSVSSSQWVQVLPMHYYFSLTAHSCNWWAAGGKASGPIREPSTKAGLFHPSLLGLWVWSFWGCSPSALCLPAPQPFVDLDASPPQGMTHQAVAPPSSKENVLISSHPRVPLTGSCQPREHHSLHNLSQPRSPRHPPSFPTPGPTYLPLWKLQKWPSAAGYQLGWRNGSRRNFYMAYVEII